MAAFRFWKGSQPKSRIAAAYAEALAGIGKPP